MENTYAFFSRLVGTMAVILLVAAYAGSTQIFTKNIGRQKNWRFIVCTGLFGGVFGIYGNISGIDFNGAMVSVRDIGPMLAGFLGGPVTGVIAGAIAGIHRLTMGGITAVACVVATTVIGLACGILPGLFPAVLKKYHWIFLIGVAMEVMHLCTVLVMVRPFSVAYDIVRQIAVPFITVNAIGITSMMGIIHFIEKEQKMSLERERLKSELEVANVIQHSLLPTLNEDYPGRPEISVSASMEAAKEVGGDFYDVFFVGTESIAFLIGDVSGKGVPAALFMASAKTVLQNCIRDIPSLSDALFRANNVLYEKNEAGMFVTVWAGILNLKSGVLTYVNAGHNPAVRISSGNTEFSKTKHGFVLAGLENIRYRESQLQMRKGDAIFLYTDGVTEATTTANEQYGDERLLACLRACEKAEVGTMIDRVIASINGFVRDNEQFDDITMLCFKWNGNGGSE